MKRAVKQSIPYEILRRLKINREFATDQRLYRRYAGPDDYVALRKITARNLEMQLTKDYHRIEKGLALPNPRSPFGSAVLGRLDALVPDASPAALDAPYVAHAESAREALRAWNLGPGSRVDDDIAPPGTQTDAWPDVQAFFRSRHSVRNYSEIPVPREVIDDAIDMALCSPSVCNRQAWKVYIFDDSASIATALRYQNGNAGFCDTIPALALITADRKMFAGANERNQVWIDGGLFAMTFAWALHGLGLTTCMLNMSQPSSALKRLRLKFDIPESEAIVMFMSIGYPAEGFRVARSPRRTVDSVRRWMNQSSGPTANEGTLQ